MSEIDVPVFSSVLELFERSAAHEMGVDKTADPKTFWGNQPSDLPVEMIVVCRSPIDRTAFCEKSFASLFPLGQKPSEPGNVHLLIITPPSP